MNARGRNIQYIDVLSLDYHEFDEETFKEDFLQNTTLEGNENDMVLQIGEKLRKVCDTSMPSCIGFQKEY